MTQQGKQWAIATMEDLGGAIEVPDNAVPAPGGSTATVVPR